MLEAAGVDLVLAPTALAATAVDSRQIDLSWAAAADGESGIARYLV
jgi:hypothetical protein